MNFSDFTSSLSIKYIYLNLYEMATAILNEKLHYFSQEQFSVDIYQMAATYELKVYNKDMTNMNLPENDFFIEIFGYLNTCSGKAIYLNQNTGNFTRRYTIAYHLAYYLLNGESTLNYVHHFVFSGFSKNFQEQICHLLASFLLMPVESVNKLMKQYQQKTLYSQPGFYSWLNYLGNTMGLPTYYTAAAFEKIRTLRTFLDKDPAGFL